ncbi:hypothetical protein K470DRAFT_258450 [Piedraia hortae CBS 480.64]|uniref:RBR-type E3 ubiquitin transferase n=1 Tax=Piedraia hortae CBS 480.64 TaxID=1314780 RepID=A0A6A7BXI9_9PEZI|nr:hypothetical protein K470DRAFT_258450 [Piedraia hortae CBS 480.64]
MPGSDRHSTRSGHSHRSSHSRKSSHSHRRHRSDKDEARTPDVEEVRRKRAAYFDSPRKERDEGSVRTRSTKSSRSDGEKRKHHRRSSQDKERRRSADYVYAPREERKLSGHHARSVSLSNITEAEVTPDDSISVVATQRARAARKPRPMPQKLQTVDEEPSPRKPARPTGFLGFFRRNPPPERPVRLVSCLTCGGDDIPAHKSAKLECGHRMCHPCLKRIFELSTKDPAHMPPRCCGDAHIPLKHVDKLFDTRFKMLWNRKYQEYHTANRVYCCSPQCGQWIRPVHYHRDSHGRQYARCPHCKTKVCTLCNSKLHKGDCPKDPEIAALIAQAKEQGWQRCFNCHSIVELKEGCNHMTCRCKAEFCMLCGTKWKGCDCPWFDYSTLPAPEGGLQGLYRRFMPQQQPRETVRVLDEERERQERLDEELARRLQAAALERDAASRARAHRPNSSPRASAPSVAPSVRAPGLETYGIGNAAPHFMNENFVQRQVAMSSVGDGNFGRRGERTSARRKSQMPKQNGGDNGLAPNFLGDESVLNFGRRR